MKRLLGLLLLALPACGQGEITCGSPADVSGTWSYLGDQVNPTAAITGTVVLERTGTCTVSGSASLTIDPGTGSPSTSNGPVSGIFSDDNSVDLNFKVQGDRLHLGEWHADTISGSWNETSGSAASGAFRLVRTGGP